MKALLIVLLCVCTFIAAAQITDSTYTEEQKQEISNALIKYDAFETAMINLNGADTVLLQYYTTLIDSFWHVEQVKLSNSNLTQEIIDGKQRIVVRDMYEERRTLKPAPVSQDRFLQWLNEVRVICTNKIKDD